MHSLLCFFLIARDRPVIVPPVPAPATSTSTLPDEGRDSVDGVPVTASTISGPVVYSCAKGLLTYNNQMVNDLQVDCMRGYSRCDIGPE